MKTKEFNFEKSVVSFEIDNKNVMVNATEMASIFGKYPKDFLIMEQTKDFINECCKDENYYELLGLKNEVQEGNSTLENEVQKGNSPFETV